MFAERKDDMRFGVPTYFGRGGRIWYHDGRGSVDILQDEEVVSESFGWGYLGRGPRASASVILKDYVARKASLFWFPGMKDIQQFKFDVISSFDSDSDMVLPVKHIDIWLSKYRGR